MHDTRTMLLRLVFLGTLVVGCSSQPARVRPVDIDPSDASSAAIEMYDKDGDGSLAAAEIDAVPGIKKHLGKYDANSDGQVSRDEIQNRLQSMIDEKTALLGATFVIHLDGQPLEGATVELVPEGYLGENVKPAEGMTGPTGLTRLSHADEFLPKTANGRPLAGVFAGTYKLQITHPSRSIPTKYNTATTIGEEIAFDINPTDAPMHVAITSK